MITENEYLQSKSIVEEFEETHLLFHLAKVLEVEVSDIISTSRKADVTVKKHAICKYLREVKRFTYAEIATIVGLKHPAVYSGIERFNDLLFMKDVRAMETWDKIKDKYL